MPHPARTLLRRLRFPLLVLLVVYTISVIGYMLIPGVDDEGQPWRMDFFHAFYFVSFMSTTIGFGEIPYAFTLQQRYWTLFTMYAAVVTWLYGIGVLLSVFQDKAFLKQLRKNKFARRINRINQPFYILCGYGDTGVQLTRLLSEQGIQTVVIDTRHPECIGIVSIVNDDNVNLTVAIIAQLLNPHIRLIARAETPEAEANILSFGANEVINPFQVFSSRLSLAMKSHSLYCLYNWMTGSTTAFLEEPPKLASGKWIICDFGRFGRSLYENLENDDVTVQVIESNRDIEGLPAGSVIGRATEAPSLKKAGIEEAVGIIAGTNNDANNLSIILTASELNPSLFRVVRQNWDKNSHLFNSAQHEMLMQRGSIIANTILAFIRTPMLGDFLRIVSRFNNEKARKLRSKVADVSDPSGPVLWEFCASKEETPALFEMIQNKELNIGDLFMENFSEELEDEESNAYKLSAMCLFIKRGDSNILLPKSSRVVNSGDRFLMCGTAEAKERMRLILGNNDRLEYALNGKPLSNKNVFRRWLEQINNPQS